MKMKFYFYLSLFFALSVSISLSAQKAPVVIKPASKDNSKDIQKLYLENSKQQYKLKQLDRDIQKTEKQLNKNQSENISAIEAIKAKTANLTEQNKKLQEDTTKIALKLGDVLNKKDSSVGEQRKKH